MRKSDIIFGFAQIFVLLSALIYIVFLQIFYNIFELGFFIIACLFLIVVTIWRVLETFRYRLEKFKPRGEGEKLMHLRMIKSLSFSIFTWSIGLAMIIPTLFNITKNQIQFAIGILMMLLGVIIWYTEYLRRNYFLEKYYKRVEQPI